MYPSTRAALSERLGSNARCLPPAVAMRRAGHLAELAWFRYQAGQGDDVAGLRPIYLHEPDAPAPGTVGAA
jgi:tRNA threonylcarbamoyladenosine biosynthesis protein TsaB